MPSMVDGGNGWAVPDFKILHKKNEVLHLDANTYTFYYVKGVYAILRIKIDVIFPNGNRKSFIKKDLELSSSGDYYSGVAFSVELKQYGEYKIEYSMLWSEDRRTYTVSVFTYIYVSPDESEVKPYSLGDTIRRVLSLTPTRTAAESPKYTFDPVQLAEYDKEESPEFAFTGHTLFEAMLMIAQYKGAFPVLRDKVISFRKMWNGIYKTAAELPEPIDEVSSRDIEQYCTYLETEVQNLVGVNNSKIGTVIDPYASGYKTTRSGSGSKISADSVIAPTKYPLYQSLKFELGYLKGKEVGDITPYVYEQGEYESLSDTSATYPSSKGYAIEWKQMSNDYTELAHRITHADSISNAFEQPALANIMYAQTGDSADTGLMAYINQLFNAKNKQSLADVMYRASYIPLLNARVKQYKDCFGDFHYDGSIKYNQTAELVDSEMYGEHLKQLLRKIGNATKQCVYIFDEITDVPEVGTVVDGYSVYDVQNSIRENEVVATVSYVKYAELSKYVGVKNPWKDSDVSINKCYKRAVSMNEFLLFTHDDSRRGNSNTVTSTALAELLRFTGLPKTLTCVEATGYTKGHEQLNTVLLPVVSLAIGNSIYFQWDYDDNYSAGYLSEEAPEGSTSKLSGSSYCRAQRAVRYCDMYGKLEYYSFKLGRHGPVADGSLLWIANDYDIEKAEQALINGKVAYKGEVKITESVPKTLSFKISEPHTFNVDITVKITFVDYTTKTVTVTIEPGLTETAITFDKPTNNRELKSALTYYVDDFEIYSNADKITQMVGYSLPLKPRNLRTTDLREWKIKEYISASDLVVEKNSSEALTFSVQLHYCSDNENFIIGSGLTNFCSLIGGSTRKTALYGFKERINIFRRRFPVDDKNHATELPPIVFDTVETEDNKRIKITLPVQINDYAAWALMGKDSNGNWQIVFGENRDLKGSEFNTELYLLPMHKMEDCI